jgi:Cu/Ag efflux pump CusA
MARFLAGVLKFRLLILAAAVGVLAVGIVHFAATPWEVLPEFSPPYAEIQTEALGLSAEEVEQLITVPSSRTCSTG